jgi:hypothetical protein
MDDCTIFTSKCVLCQYCKPFIKVMYALEILGFIGFLAAACNRSTTCSACSVGQFFGRIEAVRRNYDEARGFEPTLSATN